LIKLKLDRRYKSEKIGNVNDFDSYMMIVERKMAEKNNSEMGKRDSPAKMFSDDSPQVLSEGNQHNPLADMVKKKISRD